MKVSKPIGGIKSANANIQYLYLLKIERISYAGECLGFSVPAHHCGIPGR